jgi:PEP-CTERM motif
MRKLLLAGVALLAINCGSAASAAVVTWNTWNSATSGTDGPLTVTFSSGGSLDNLYTGNYPSYTPTTTYADGTIVNNAPLPTNRIIQLQGGNTNLQTVTFSQAVVDPIFAIWSLGAGGNTATFVFNQTPTFVVGGPSAEYGGGPISVTGNTVSGTEGNGTIEFLGTFNSITWTNPNSEFWYGFNVGFDAVAPVPEASTWAMMILGFCAVGFMAHRKRKTAFALTVA